MMAPMAQNLNPEEVEEQHIRGMGRELGSVYNRLHAECTMLNSTWRQFVELFGTSEKRVEVITWSASHFFWVVRDVFLESTLLKLSRITDPAATGNKRNVTLRLLPPLVDSVLRPEVEGRLDAVSAATAFARDWRNRHIAHYDFALIFDQAAAPLTPATRRDISEAIKAVNEVLNLVEDHYLHSMTAFEHLIAAGQADDLLQLLNSEFVREQQFQERLRTRELTDDDLRKRPTPLI